ncbi:unnamed protein product [Brassicogethes aeneus]|uniref:Insulin-like domain-containing protein n=1 Tax=Brassicogethes aeneus TaxID=1431903 RepID=A0A9P0FLV7_BRAAE|nr:unnamed protein product [Brassicogethes aeneus]
MEFRYGLLLTVFIFGITNCQLDDIEEMFSRRKYCGENLSRILSTICQGKYNTLIKKDYYKKTFDADYQSDDPGPAPATQPYRPSYALTRESANSMLSRAGTRRKRGVYNECCEKSCSRDELTSYCDPSVRYTRSSFVRR